MYKEPAYLKKKTRLKVYELALKRLSAIKSTYSPDAGFCFQIPISAQMITGRMVSRWSIPYCFPEIWKLKPDNRDLGEWWWKPGRTDVRIKFLKKIIKELKYELQKSERIAIQKKNKVDR